MRTATPGKGSQPVAVDEASPLLHSFSPVSPAPATYSSPSSNLLSPSSVTEVQLAVFRRKYSASLDKFLRGCKYGDRESVEAVVTELRREKLGEEVGGVLEEESYRKLNLKLLLHSRGTDTLTGLQLACYYDQQSVARYLVSLAKEVLSSDELKAVLEAKANYGKGAATALMLCSSFSLCRLLLEAGASHSSTDSIGMTPLHYASSSDNPAIIAVLVRYGADVNMQDKRGATPLHWAVFEGFHYTAMLLVASGADQTLQDAQGQTPLMLACTLGDAFLAKQLVLEGAPVHIRDSLGRTALDLSKASGSESTTQALKNGRSDRLMAEASEKRLTVLFFFSFFSLGVFLWLVFVLPFLASVLEGTLLLSLNTVEILALCLSLMVAGSYTSVWLTSPGYIPKGDPLVFEELLASEEGPLPCPSCRIKKTARIKHCHSCGRCVHRFDHHCPWISNCVGLFNHRQFVLFCFLFVVEMALMISSLIAVFFQNVREKPLSSSQSLYGSLLSQTILSPLSDSEFVEWCALSECRIAAQIGLLLLSVIFGIPTLILLIIQTSNISRNITVNETFNKDKYEYMKDQNGFYLNPFDRGFIRNWTEFLCADRSMLAHRYLAMEVPAPR